MGRGRGGAGLRLDRAPRRRPHGAGRTQDRPRPGLAAVHRGAQGLPLAAAELRLRRPRRQHRHVRRGAGTPAQARERAPRPGAGAGLARGLRLGRLHPLRGAAPQLQPAGRRDRDRQSQDRTRDLPPPHHQRVAGAPPCAAHRGAGGGRAQALGGELQADPGRRPFPARGRAPAAHAGARAGHAARRGGAPTARRLGPRHGPRAPRAVDLRHLVPRAHPAHLRR